MLCGGHHLSHAFIAHFTVRAQMQYGLRLPLRCFRNALVQVLASTSCWFQNTLPWASIEC